MKKSKLILFLYFFILFYGLLFSSSNKNKPLKKGTPGYYYNLGIENLNNGFKGLSVYYFKMSLRVYPFYRKPIKALNILGYKTEYPLRLAVLLLLFFTISLFYFLLFFYFIFRKRGKVMLVFIFLFLIAVFLLLNREYKRATFSGRAIVVKKNVFLRLKPVKSSVKIVKLEEGDEVKIIGKLNSWLKVEKDNFYGWVRKDFIKMFE